MTDLARPYGYRDGSGVHRVIPRLEARAKEDRKLAQNLKSLAAKMPGVILPAGPEIQQPPQSWVFNSCIEKSRRFAILYA